MGAQGGAFAPIAMMPAWAQAVAPFSPGYWAMAVFRAAAAGDTGATVQAALVLTAVGAVAGTVACVRVGRGLGELRG